MKRYLLLVALIVCIPASVHAAQLALISAVTYKKDVNNIGDIVAIVEDDHQFTRWEKEMFTIVRVPGTVKEVKEKIIKVIGSSDQQKTKYFSNIPQASIKQNMSMSEVESCVSASK